MQKQFTDELKRVLTSHQPRQLLEAAVVTCVKLCKAATYINITDGTNVLFRLVQSVVQDIKVWYSAASDHPKDQETFELEPCKILSPILILDMGKTGCHGDLRLKGQFLKKS